MVKQQRNKQNKQLESKKKKNHKPTIYPAIPNSTIATLIGESRWKKVKKFLLNKYGARKFMFAFSEAGPTIQLLCPPWKTIGTLAEVEKRIKKDRK